MTSDFKLSFEQNGWLCEKAPAKVNLFLHVVGRRENGFHELESLFLFTEFGDEVRVRKADGLSLKIEGGMANELSGEKTSDNLVIKAAKALRSFAGNENLGANIFLEKNIPTGAGLGGGSSDAAATLRGLVKLWQLDIKKEELEKIALGLGADVPSCLNPKTSFVEGVGEQISASELMGDFACVLVNDGTHISTPQVFKSYKEMDMQFSQSIKPNSTGKSFDISLIQNMNNDLMPVVEEIAPCLKNIICELKKSDHVILARMSGSGASFFCLTQTLEQAERVAKTLNKTHANWWVKPTGFL